jgi:hypothetical protein
MKCCLGAKLFVCITVLPRVTLLPLQQKWIEEKYFGAISLRVTRRKVQERFPTHTGWLSMAMET